MPISVDLSRYGVKDDEKASGSRALSVDFTKYAKPAEPFKIPGVMSDQEVSDMLHPPAVAPVAEPKYPGLQKVIDRTDNLKEIGQEATRNVMAEQAADEAQYQENIGPYLRGVEKFHDKYIDGNFIGKALDALQGADRAVSNFKAGALDTATLGVTQGLGREALKSISGGEENLLPVMQDRKESTGYKAGEIAGYLPPGALADRLVVKAGGKLLERLPAVAKGLVRGSAAGALDMANQEAGDVAFRQGEFNPENVALGAGLGAGLGAAIPAIGAGVKSFKQRGLRKEIGDFVDRMNAPRSEPTHPSGAIVQEAPSSNITSRADAAAGNFKRRENIQRQYDDAVENQYQLLKKQMDERGGVTQGNVVTDPTTGEVIDRFGRTSNNPKWYSDFFAQNGRKPNQKELRELAEEQVKNGYSDDFGNIPPWKPKDIEDIDEELASVRAMMSTAKPEERAALQQVAETLESSRGQIRKQLPEGVQALTTRTPSVKAAAQTIGRKRSVPRTDAGDIQQATTANGRPILPRGDGTGTEQVKRSDIIADLAKKLDVTVRTGRFRQQAHGIFKTKSEVVRTKLTNDLPVISHEIGHKLDKQYGLANSQFDDELQKVGAATSKDSYTKAQVRAEGIAEFIRRYLTEPEQLKIDAPKFWAHFEATIPKDVRKVLTDAREQVQKYINQSIRLKSLSELSIGKNGLVERLKRINLPTLSDLYTKFVDELHPIKKALQQLGEKGEDVFNSFRLLKGVTGRAKAFLKYGIPDSGYGRSGKSFSEVLAPVKNNMDDFRSYIKDMRAIELEDRGIMTGSDLTREERVMNIRDLEAEHPEFIQAHAGLKNYQDRLLDELIDGGILSVDDVLKFKEGNQEYVPFFRVYESEVGAGPTKGGRTSIGQGVADQSSPIKRIKGSDREIIDPIESIIKNTYQYLATAERNKTLTKFIDVAIKEDGLGGLVEQIPTPMQGQKFTLEDLRTTLEKEGVDTDSIDMDSVVNIFRPSTVIPGKDNVIRVFRDGKAEFYQLDPALYRAVTAADSEKMNMLMRVANFPVRMLRTGIVNTMEFWLKNMFRDQFAAMNNSKNGFVPWIDMFKGMAHVLGKSDTFQKFLSSGGAQGLMTSMDQKYLQNDLRAILADGVKDKAMNVIKNPLEAMRVLSELSELGTRVGDFSKGIAKDGSAQGIRQAAVNARDLMDFGRAGTYGKHINKLSVFWNSAVQGLDKTIRTFTDPKTAPKAFAKSLTAITLPTAVLYAHNRKDPRYQELPQWDKDVYWHFWVGDKHYRLPIPFELGVMFKTIPERVMSAVAKDDEQPTKDLAKTAWKNASPIPVPWDAITALAPLIQAYANRNAFDTPIVPRREEGLLPEDQAGPYTSDVAKRTAKVPVLNNNFVTKDVFASPRKVDHIIRGYTGSLGQYATQIADAAGRLISGKKKPAKPDTGLETLPGFKGIMAKTLGAGSESLDNFYDKKDELSREKASADKKEVPFDNASELKRLNKISADISKASKEIRRIEEDPDMTGKQKTQAIRELNLNIVNLARFALDKDELKWEDLYKADKE